MKDAYSSAQKLDWQGTIQIVYLVFYLFALFTKCVLSPG